MEKLDRRDEYEWIPVTLDAAFAARDGAGLETPAHGQRLRPVEPVGTAIGPELTLVIVGGNRLADQERHREIGIAIAALEAQATGARKVAVYDFDVHHGNGTEAILLNKPDTAFFSIHQHPCYPGTGTKNVGNNCFNYPVAPKTPREEYRKSGSGFGLPA